MWFQYLTIALLVLILGAQVLILINMRNMAEWAAVISRVITRPWEKL